MKKVNLFTVLLILVAAMIFSYVFLKVMLWLGFLVVIAAVVALYFLFKKKENT